MINDEDVDDSKYMSVAEDDNEQLYDTSEKILKLNDALAEDIILDNINEQFSEDIDTNNPRINYVGLFKEKYSTINPSDDFYDEAYLKESLEKVAIAIGSNIKKRYGVELGEDLDYTAPLDYFTDMETLYEFLFIRNYQNIIDYINYKLRTNRASFIASYKDKMSEDAHAKDLFVIQSKKKFKNDDDVLILHFMNEIITDIKDSTFSAYDLFDTVTKLDLYEEYNNRMSELLINYGNKIVLNNDADSAKLYLKPLDNPAIFSEIRNSIVMSYLEECEVNV